MDLRVIGQKIKEKRLEKAWSQEQLAEKVNLTPIYIGMIERGEKLPRLETFINIINILNVSADEVLADVLVEGYKVKITKYSDQIKRLNQKEQRRLFRILDAYLKDE